MAQVAVHKTAGGNAAFHNFHNDYAHITDPNERRRLALAEIDKAPFGWYHVRAIVVAGIGFFTDAYDLFAINMVTAMLGVVYWHDAVSKPGTLPSHADTAIKVATSSGTGKTHLLFYIAPRFLTAISQLSVRLDLAFSQTLLAARKCMASS